MQNGNFKFLWLHFAAAALAVFFNCPAMAQEEKKAEELKPTHRQTKVIRPMLQKSEDGQEADKKDSDAEGKEDEGKKQPAVYKAPALKTFCLANDGTILAGLSSNGKHAIQMLDPDGVVKKQVKMEFEPQAINQSPNGTIFVAGPGKLAKLSESGEVIASVDSPWGGDAEEMKKEVKKQIEEQLSAMTAAMEESIERIDARIEKLEEKAEDERTERDKKRLESLVKQKKAQEEQVESYRESLEEQMGNEAALEQMLAMRMSSTGVAANTKDLFVCASGAGHGYEVWRMDHDFKEPEKVVGSLGGCCGQCDIQCTEENLVVAANTEFSVQIRDRNGEEVSKFGNRGGKEGFGSCCNPMNVRMLENGDCLTAESSIGWIKRFNKEGELVGIVGKAKIGGGCKHVPIGFNPKLDRYYMQYEDKSEICVLDPTTGETSPEELAAKEAKEGLGQKLIGKWKMDAEQPKEGENEDEQMGFTIASRLEFVKDGTLKSKGMPFSSGESSWEPVKQDGSKIKVEHLYDGSAVFVYEIEFVSDDEIKVKYKMDENELGAATYKRLVAKKAAEKDSAKKSEKSETEKDK